MIGVYSYNGEDRIVDGNSTLKKGTLLSYDTDTGCLYNPVTLKMITNPLVISDILQKCTQQQCIAQISSKVGQSTSEKTDDNVNHPAHYTSGSIECIDAMTAAFGKESVQTFCKLNAFKYLWRANLKNKDEDIDKAIWYLNKYKKLQ